MAKSSTSIKPGERRNPSGRPPRTEAETEALEILRAATPAAARALVLALDGPESVKAAIALLDRVLGKPASAPEDRAAVASADLLRNRVAVMLSELNDSDRDSK